MGAIAFFDVDKTILARNTATLWVRRERKLGKLSARHAMLGAAWVLLYELGLVHADDVIRKAVRGLRGTRERDVIERTMAFWHEEVAHLVRPGARETVARHKEQGDLCFLLTSTSNYMSMPLCDALQLDGWLANRFVVEDGHFTGEPVEPVCFGAGKRTHAEACAAKVNVALEECWFYTDSLSDLPALLAVGHPVAVNPDPRLRREASRRGWPVEDWGVPAPGLLGPAKP